MKESAIIGNAYKNAKRTIIIDGTKYYLYAALSRKSKNFKHLIPYYTVNNNVTVLVDIKSDVCLVYGTEWIKRMLENDLEHRFKVMQVSELTSRQIKNINAE